MRKVLMTCVALLGASGGTLLAQPAAPAVAMPGTGAAPDTGTTAGGGMTGLRPMRGQPKQAVGTNHFTHKPPGTAPANAKRRNGRAAPANTTTNDGMGGPRTGDRGGDTASTHSPTGTAMSSAGG